MGKKIKCVVWDLDNTIWKGILSEDSEVQLKPHILEIIKELDARGILQSISSKNYEKYAIEKMKEMGIEEYFIYPQINWESKADSVENIAKSINIGIDTLMFIDDQPFERDEVSFAHPEVLCIAPPETSEEFLKMDELNPRFITADSKIRRVLYQTDIIRNEAEMKFNGSKIDFLKTLGMKLSIKEAAEEDLQRAEELTVRTHQMNSTGYTYSYEELKELISSPEYKVLVVKLEDKYGTYGVIGLALLRTHQKYWNIYLLLMSCRVMSRGIGSVLINFIINLARENGVELKARFVPTDRNRTMYMTYKFANFSEISNDDNMIVFQADLKSKRIIPDYYTIEFNGIDGIKY